MYFQGELPYFELEYGEEYAGWEGRKCALLINLIEYFFVQS